MHLQVVDIYADAFLATIADRAAEERACSELRLVSDVFVEAPQLLERLGMPSLDPGSRCRIINTTFGPLVGKGTLGLLLLLSRRGRMALIPLMSDALRKRIDKRDGVVDVTVICARIMEGPLRIKLEIALRRQFGDQSRIRYATDPALIGGFCISTGERLSDCAVRSGHDQLKITLISRELK